MKKFLADIQSCGSKRTVTKGEKGTILPNISTGASVGIKVGSLLGIKVGSFVGLNVVSTTGS